MADLACAIAGDEGFYLTIPGAPEGPFAPLVPAVGLTVFTTAFEERTA